MAARSAEGQRGREQERTDVDFIYGTKDAQSQVNNSDCEHLHVNNSSWFLHSWGTESISMSSFRNPLQAHWLELSTCFIHSWKRNCAILLQPSMSVTIDHSVQHNCAHVHFSCWHFSCYLSCHTNLSEPIQCQCQSLAGMWRCIFQLTRASLPKALPQRQNASLEWTSSHHVAVCIQAMKAAKQIYNLLKKLTARVIVEGCSAANMLFVTNNTTSMLTPSIC